MSSLETSLQQHARLLVDSVKDYAIFMLDTEGRVVTWNAGARQIKGFEAQEIIGQHISRFYTLEDNALGRPARLLRVAASEGRVEDEGWRVKKDGSRFWADVVITRLIDGDGQLVGFAKVTRDLTVRKAAEDGLRAREQSLRATLLSIGDAVIATDTDARVTRLNPVAEELTGWSEARALGRPIDEVFRIVNEDTRQPAENPVRTILEEGTVIGLASHTALVGLDGVERPIADSGAPIRDESGNITGVVLVFRDVTDERRLETALIEREERLRLMVDSVRDHAIFMLDPLGHVTSWNSGAERVTGYSSQEILGSNFANLYPPEEIAAGKPEQALDEARERGHADDEGWRVGKDGKMFWASAVISAIRDDKGTLLGFTKVTRDMTERRRMEQEVEEQRIVAAEARTAVKERDEFISVAAHELRTPLTALLLKLQSVERGLRKPPPQAVGLRDLHGRLEGAVKQTERLTDLVERLLDVSRIASGRLELRLEEFDLAELVRNVVQDFKDAAEKGSSELRLESDRAVVGLWDRTRLEQVVTNLLSNAVKYGDRNPIDVHVGVRRGLATVIITDRGIGIAPADYLRIFSRFERAAPLRHYGGLGLGLYVTRYLVEAHGGTVSVESDAQRGTTFVIELPLAGERLLREAALPPGSDTEARQ